MRAAATPVVEIIDRGVVDLRESPREDKNHPLHETSHLILGDGNGNTLVHIEFLKAQGVLQMSDATYARLAEIYYQGGATLKGPQLAEFEKLLMGSIPADSPLRRGGIIENIGDDFNDSGENDELTLIAIKSLIRSGIFCSRNISNHDSIMLHELADEKPSFTRGGSKFQSMVNLGELIAGRRLSPNREEREAPVITLASFKKDFNRFVKPFYKAINYTINENLDPPNFTIHWHAPAIAAFERLEYLAKLFNVPYRENLFKLPDEVGYLNLSAKESIPLYRKVIDQINARLAEHLRTQSPQTLYQEYLDYLQRKYDETMVDENIDQIERGKRMTSYSPGGGYVPVEQDVGTPEQPRIVNTSLFALMWQRGEAEIEHIIRTEFPAEVAVLESKEGKEWEAILEKIAAKKFPNQAVNGIHFSQVHGHEGSLEKFFKERGLAYHSPAQSYLPKMTNVDRAHGRVRRKNMDITEPGFIGKYHVAYIQETSVPIPHPTVKLYRNFPAAVADLLLDLEDIINLEKTDWATKAAAVKLYAAVKFNEFPAKLTDEEYPAARQGELGDIIMKLQTELAPKGGVLAAAADAIARPAVAGPALGGLFAPAPVEYVNLSDTTTPEKLFIENTFAKIPDKGSYAEKILAFKDALSKFSGDYIWHSFLITPHGQALVKTINDNFSVPLFKVTQRAEETTYRQMLFEVYASYFMKSLMRKYTQKFLSNDDTISATIKYEANEFRQLHVNPLRASEIVSGGLDKITMAGDVKSLEKTLRSLTSELDDKALKFTRPALPRKNL